MSSRVYFPKNRLLAGLSALALLAACNQPLDFDLRGNTGGFTTAPAAQGATARRPEPDDRGIISYPTYQVAVARRGDTVTDVAQRIGLPPKELADFNGIDPAVTLRKGEVLALPRRVSDPVAGNVDIATLAGDAIDASPNTPAVETTTLDPAASTAGQPSQVLGSEPIRHKVARGETAFTISRLYQVPVSALAEWNSLGPDFTIREGQFLMIPVPDGTVRSSTRPPATTPRPGQGSPTPVPPSASAPLPADAASPEKPEEPEVSVGTPSDSGAAMAMPVLGKIVSLYKKGKNDGIDISGAPGASVFAAEKGTVAAITEDADQVPVVLVRHADNILSIYANVTGIKVKKGDTVKRGQTIARLRDGDKSYLHFEVLDGFDSVDPMLYLK